MAEDGEIEQELRRRLALTIEQREDEAQPDEAFLEATLTRLRAGRAEVAAVREPAAPHLTMGVVASRRLRDGPLSPLVRLFREFEPMIRSVLRPTIYAVAGSHDALHRHGVLTSYEELHRLPPGAAGSLVHLTHMVGAKSSDGVDPVDVVIYLSDPSDPTSNNPEALALQLECNIAQKILISNYATAWEWFTLLWLRYGSAESVDQHFVSEDIAADLSAHAQVQAPDVSIDGTGAAFIADDPEKIRLIQLFRDNLDLFSTFGRRVATEATGQLLNGALPPRLMVSLEDDSVAQEGFEQVGMGARLPQRLFNRRMQADELRRELEKYEEALRAANLTESEWVELRARGDDGGVNALAYDLLVGTCQRVFILEWPQRLYHYDQEAQVLQRTTDIPELNIVGLRGWRAADEWANNYRQASKLGRIGRRSIVRAFRSRFGVECVIADDHSGSPPSDPHDSWKRVVKKAAEHVLSIASHTASQGQVARIGVSWGASMHNLVTEVATLLTAAGDPNDIHELLPALGEPARTAVVPLLGVTDSPDPRVQANEVAHRLAEAFATQPSVTCAYPAFLSETELPEIQSMMKTWLDVDIAILTACQRDRTVDRAVQHMSPDEEGQVRGVVAGILLDEDGKEITPKGLTRFGIAMPTLQEITSRGGTVLLAGVQPERLWPCLTALRAGIVSTLVTDAEFAQALLRLEANSSVLSMTPT